MSDIVKCAGSLVFGCFIAICALAMWCAALFAGLMILHIAVGISDLMWKAIFP